MNRTVLKWWISYPHICVKNMNNSVFRIEIHRGGDNSINRFHMGKVDKYKDFKKGVRVFFNDLSTRYKQFVDKYRSMWIFRTIYVEKVLIGIV